MVHFLAELTKGPVCMEFPTLLSLVHILPLCGSTVFCTQIKKGIFSRVIDGPTSAQSSKISRFFSQASA
jgi:hypothetical protein